MAPTPAAVLVFVTSAAVLTLEILAIRLLAPYVGVTLETYTGIIGVVLGGISLGAWGGGWLADRWRPRAAVGPLVMLGGALALATVPAVHVLGPRLRGGGPSAIVTLAFVGFFAPAAVLSAVTPTVAKLRLGDLAHTGRVVGGLSAVATAGAIAGTFATGFVLVAAFPTRAVIVVLAAVLVVTGLLVSLRLGTSRTGVAGLIPIVALGAVLSASVRSPCEVETAYFCARVLVDTERPTGRVLVLDTLRHSYVDLADPTHLEFRYARLFGDVISTFRPPGRAVTALHIGGGGFTIPRYIAATRPGSVSLVLELDPNLVELARARLGLATSEDLAVRTGDARLGILAERDGSYDLVVGDAFGGLAVPWHLTTLEFAEQVRRVLRDDGIYVLNVIDYPPLRFLRAEVATLQAAFPHVAMLVTSAEASATGGGNFVVVAGEAVIDVAALEDAVQRRGGTERVLSGAALRDYVRGARPLTDDRAPVDQLITHS